jgi:hypothetical protein
MLNLKSKLLYLEHLMLKKLITEQQTMSGLEKRIIDAMKSQRVMKFSYAPPQDPDRPPTQYRDVEIYAIGTNKFGHRVIYAWIRNASSKTLNAQGPRKTKSRYRIGTQRDRIRWRMFRLEGIQSLNYTTNTFEIDPNKVKLNQKFDKSLKDVTTIFDLQIKK